jgi:hypothetical protein
VDDTSILFAHSNFIDFNNSNNNNVHKVLEILNKWFKVNLLYLNFNKSHFTHNTTMRNKTIDLNIGYKDKLISNILHPKFLGIILGSTLTWSNNIELLTKN